MSAIRPHIAVAQRHVVAATPQELQLATKQALSDQLATLGLAPNPGHGRDRHRSASARYHWQFILVTLELTNERFGPVEPRRRCRDCHP